MQNPFPYSSDNKRYYTWSHYLRQVFGNKVGKLSLNGGFTCPNKDGSKGVGGCIYCSPSGGGDFAGHVADSIVAQCNQQKEIIHRKWPDAKFLAYFQCNSNTYAPVDTLRKRYAQALSQEGVVGICIATRADLLDSAVLNYLEELNGHTWLLVELGLQSVHDKTSRWINRCHDYADFLEGYNALQSRRIRTCVHIINGLPCETREMMLQTARQIGALHPHSVKIHMLHVLKNTRLEQLYLEKPFALLNAQEYVQLVCDQLELLPPEIVVQRLTGDGAAEELIEPLWTMCKRHTLNQIDHELLLRNSWQGKRLAVVTRIEKNPPCLLDMADSGKDM